MKKIFLFSLLIYTALISTAIFANTQVLISGESKKGSADIRQYSYYKIHALAGDTISVKAEALDADGDLYIKIGSQASTSTHDCKSENSSTSDETCTVTLSNDADVYIALYAYKCINDVQHTMTATIQNNGISTLISGEPVNGVANKKQYSYYKIHALAGDTISVKAEALDADGDLYVKIGSQASTSTHDCKSENSSTSDEACTVTLSNDADVYIALYAYKCINNVQHTMTATIQNNGVSTLISGESVNGVANKKQYSYYKIQALAGDTISVKAEGLDADGDLYVKIGSQASTSTHDCKSENSSTSDEACTVTLSNDADVYIALYAYKCINNVQHTMTANIQARYGLSGQHSVSFEEYADEVAIYYPSDIRTDNPIPAVFFSPGWNTWSHTSYKTILNFIASHGYMVIFVPDLDKADIGGIKYPQKFKEIAKSVDVWNYIDTTRIGVAGYSYGGGYAFKLLNYLNKTEGWGGNAQFIFLMEPMEAFGMSEADMRGLPSNTNVIIQQYGSGGNNLVNNTSPGFPLTEYSLLDSIANDKKDYQIFVNANHDYPKGSQAYADKQGILKPLDALMDYTFGEFADNASAKAWAYQVSLEQGGDNPYTQDPTSRQKVLSDYGHSCDELFNYLINYCSFEAN